MTSPVGAQGDGGRMDEAVEAAAGAIYREEGPGCIDADGAEALALVAVAAAWPVLAAGIADKIRVEAARLRDHAEAFLYDGDNDAALPGYVEVYGVADALAALGATDGRMDDETLVITPSSSYGAIMESAHRCLDAAGVPRYPLRPLDDRIDDLARELGDTRARLAAVEHERDHAAVILRDYMRLGTVDRFAAALGATDQAGPGDA